MNNFLRILLCIVAGVSGLAAAAQYLAVIPPGTIPEQWIKQAMAASLIMLAVKEGIIVIGDILDDGVRNNSFNIDKLQEKRPAKGETTNVLIGLLFIGLLAFMLAGCTGPQRQAARTRLEAAALRVVEATSKAAAAAALAEAEAELTKLETTPLRSGATAIEIEGRAAAIAEGRRLVADLRRKVFAWSLTPGGKQPLSVNP